jgi:NhaA family Na+:H+ antiporter
MSSSNVPPSLADRLSRPFLRYFELEAGSAILLFAMTVAALVWANSAVGDTYERFWHVHLAASVGTWHFEMTLGHFVNDVLMTIFFFVVGLEIKREMVHGELSTRQRAMLPVAGALGGMVVPALIYTSFHYGGPAIRGWGVPMATDIAFAVAAMSLLGSRVPPSLKVFLLALAIADDLGAVAVIAIFYTEELSLAHFIASLAGLCFVFGLNRAGVRSFVVYWIAGALVWYYMVRSGVHPTVAGVFLGFLTPTRPRDPFSESLLDRGRHWVENLFDSTRGAEDHRGQSRHRALRQLRRMGLDALSPLDYLVNELDRWVAFLVMPVFALANAGVAIDASTLSNPMTQKVGVAVAVGLLVGKPIGITLFSYLAVRSGLAVLPRGVNWGAVAATGLLAGIGFTVALFITSLAFQDAAHTAGAKLGILSGSALATILGLLVLHRSLGTLPAHDGRFDREMSGRSSEKTA